ncbi:MAG: hypothetical protein C0614_06530 [Desulfuromonas sp.]|nr:MAG: hypothetical protein C0614_06530 [Desulfuromonas sp.]
MSVLTKYVLILLCAVLWTGQGFAATTTECYQKVCAVLTVPDQASPGEPFEVTVEGYIEGATAWDTSAYKFLQDATWSYSDTHMVIAEGEVLDVKGLNWGGSFTRTYRLSRDSGVYNYTFLFGSRNHQHGYYDVAVDAQVKVASATVSVALDIKPQFCPNPLNVSANGLLPVAVVGTDDFDVTSIDPASLTLAGVAPIHTAYEDVAEPFFPLTDRINSYDCTLGGPDGLVDLTLKFRAQEVSAALNALYGRPLVDGEVVAVALNGALWPVDGQAQLIVGEDLVTIINNEPISSQQTLKVDRSRGRSSSR